jgi:PhnB protein
MSALNASANYSTRQEKSLVVVRRCQIISSREGSHTAEETTMAIKSINPYLNFNGTAEKAIRLYESALGAKAENVMRFGDGQGMDVAPEDKNRVMHAALHIGDGLVMVSDTMPNMPKPAGNNVHVSLDCDDPADMAKKFDALAAGGQVTMPLQDTFWGAKFGMLTDAFGINWMFNCQTKK